MPDTILSALHVLIHLGYLVSISVTLLTPHTYKPVCLDTHTHAHTFAVEILAIMGF